MRINTNVSSLVAQEAAQNTSKTLTSSLEKLSTGLRINKASDDASGLAIADKLRTQGTSIVKQYQTVIQLFHCFKLLINLWLNNQQFWILLKLN